MTSAELKYLMAINALYDGTAGIKLTAIVAKMNVTKVSVYRAAERMERNGYIRRDEKNKVVINQSGYEQLEKYNILIHWISNHLRRSGAVIMASLIALLGSLAYIMLLAVLNGSLGFVCAMGVPLFGAIGIAKAMGEAIPLSHGLIIGLAIGCGVLRGALRALCPAKLEGKQKGSIIAMITSDIETLEVFYAHTISPICIAVIVSAAAVVFVGMVSSWYLALIALAGYIAVGIVGESGCGKSTFLKLLLRFWQKNQGTIAYNGTDIEQIDTESLLENVTMVSQVTYLFDETVADNLRIAKPDATMDEIEAACRMASVHDFIMTLPDGYDTRVGALGDNLSAGEKQRLGLARAFLRGSDLILLDEPTSNVDSINEGIILVSHRESTMAVADRVYRVEGGRMYPVSNA